MKIEFLKCEKLIGKEVIEKYKNLQVLNSRYIAGREHVEFALNQANKAFERGENISDNLLVELIVRASANRKIKRAFELYGLPSKEVVVLGNRVPNFREYNCVSTRGEMTPERYEEIKKIFDAQEKEIGVISRRDFKSRAKTLQEIIKERIALLNAL